MAERKRKKVSRFIDIEADEASSDTISPLASDEISDPSFRNDSSANVGRGESWQTFTSKLEKKYASEIESEKNRQQRELLDLLSESEEEEEEEYAESVSVKAQSQLRPTQNSPKLFLLRVKTGNERNVFFRLRGEVERQKTIVTMSSPDEFENFSSQQDSNALPETLSNRNVMSKMSKIFSIIYKESLPGYLFVESFSKQAVANLVEDIRFIKKRYISPVPVDEMIEVLTFQENVVSVNSFVRVKKGNLRDEVGQIVEQISSELIKVKFVPFANNKKETVDVSALLKDSRNQVGRTANPNEVKINGQLYDQEGYLLRKLRINEVKLNANATLEEIEMFKKSKNIDKGDTIQIKKGEMKSLKGKVSSISDTHLQVQMENDLKVTLRYDEVAKAHNLGDTVSFNNENGIIVHLDNENAIVAFNNFTREERVPISQLKNKESKYEVKKPPPRQRMRRDPLLGKSIMITHGKHKGYQGVVKDVIRKNLLVELISNLERIEIVRDHVIQHSDRSGQSPAARSPGYRSPGRYSPGLPAQKTPVYSISGYKTPAAGYKTPSGYKTPTAAAYKTPSAAGYKTPAAMTGYKTPSGAYKTPSGLGYRTPGYNPLDAEVKTPGDQYDPGYKTPGYKTPGYKTPGYKTPGYKTPGYRTPGLDRSYKPGEEYEDPIEQQTSEFYGTLVRHNNQETEVKDILFADDGDFVVLKNNEKIQLGDIEFVTPEQFNKVVILKGEFKGKTGMLVRLIGQKGIVRGAGLGAIEVELDRMSKISM